MSKRLVWWNGKLIPESEAKVSIYDSAMLFGDTVFEMSRSFNNVQFKLDEHIHRLFKSAALLDLKIPYSIDEIIGKTVELGDKEKITNGYIRHVVWRGSE